MERPVSCACQRRHTNRVHSGTAGSSRAVPSAREPVALDRFLVYPGALSVGSGSGGVVWPRQVRPTHRPDASDAHRATVPARSKSISATLDPSVMLLHDGGDTMIPDPKTSTAVNATASRRHLLKGAAALGLAATVLPRGTFAPDAAAPARQNDPKTLTIAVNGTATNLDPHSSYEYRSTLAIRGPFQGLIALDGGAMDKYVGVIAESWSPNADKSVWTFKIHPGVTFQ